MKIPETMRAIAIDRHGGPSVLSMHELPVPPVGANEVLIAVNTAGVGEWDAAGESRSKLMTPNRSSRIRAPRPGVEADPPSDPDREVLHAGQCRARASASRRRAHPRQD